MPGFKVNNVGGDANGKPIPYYKYTWEFDSIFNTKNDPSLVYLRDASTPSWIIDKEIVPGASLQYKFAKSIMFEDIKVTWYDTLGFEAIIRAWRELVWTPDGGFAEVDTYKQESIISPTTFDGSNKVPWRLINSWPNAIKTGDLTYVESDIKLVEVTICYDWAEEIVGSQTVVRRELPATCFRPTQPSA